MPFSSISWRRIPPEIVLRLVLKGSPESPFWRIAPPVLIWSCPVAALEIAEVGKREKEKGERERDFPLFPFTFPPISSKFFTFARGLIYVNIGYTRCLF